MLHTHSLTHSFIRQHTNTHTHTLANRITVSSLIEINCLLFSTCAPDMPWNDTNRPWKFFYESIKHHRTVTTKFAITLVWLKTERDRMKRKMQLDWFQLAFEFFQMFSFHYQAIYCIENAIECKWPWPMKWRSISIVPFGMENNWKVTIFWPKFIKPKIICPKPLKCWKISHSKPRIFANLLINYSVQNVLWLQFCRISTENIDILTEIGILYLRINDTKGAFDKLFEVTKLHENCSKALLALGSILQVSTFSKMFLNLFTEICLFSSFVFQSLSFLSLYSKQSRKTMLMEHLISIN